MTKSCILATLLLLLIFNVYTPAQIIIATKPYLGVNGACTLQVNFRNGLSLTRPLIVVEGFDPGHIMNPEQPFGDLSLENFRTSLRTSQNLENRINSLYDIVYVNWVNGTDFLQRNAYALEAVIQWVNEQKSLAGVNIPNTILGQSMGGVIARYALKDMENNGQSHQVSLFISHDAPHQGANIPQGLQHAARVARDQFIRTPFVAFGLDRVRLFGRTGFNRAINMADEPASRQMLANYITPSNTIDNSMHVAWQNELTAMGYPQGDAGSSIVFEKVAISNGAECGAEQEFSAGENLINIQGRASTRFIGDLLMHFVALGMNNLEDVIGQPPFYLGMLPGKNDFNFDIRVNAQADGFSNQILFTNITYTKNLLWVIPINSTLNNRSFSSSASTLPLDHYPGGSYRSQIDLEDYQDQLVSIGLNASVVRTFNFVPTVSALDIGSGVIALTKADYQVPYVGADPPTGAKSSPFDNFITAVNTLPGSSTRNEDHISFSPRNGNWLRDELDGLNPISPDCRFSCENSQFSISGPASFCSSQTYAVSNLPSNANIIWVASPINIVNVINNADRSVTLTKVVDGDFQLTAIVMNNCGSALVLEKDLTVGFAPFNGVMNGPTSVFPNAYYYYSVNLPFGVSGIKSWIVSSGWSVTAGQGSDQATIRTGTTNGTVTFRITKCGTSRDIYKNVTVDGGGTPLQPDNSVVDPSGENNINSPKTIMTVSPNPGKGLVSITLSPSSLKEEYIKIVQITDALGSVKKAFQYSPGTLKQTVMLGNLASGIYLIRVHTGIKWLQTKIIVVD